MLKETIPLNLVPISGMQGSGKDTLIEDLFNAPASSKECMMPFEIMRYKKCDMTSYEDIIERQVRRIAKYVIDWRRAIKMAKENPNCMIITDRCYHDAICYLTSFQTLGWITEDQYDWLHDLLKESFRPWSTNQIKPFFLNPPLSFIRQNLQKRARAGQEKWKESDIDYIDAVFKSYNHYLSKDDSRGIVGYTDDPDLIPAYEYIGTDRAKRVMDLMVCLKRRWQIYKGEIKLPYDEEDPRRWLMNIPPKG